MNLVDTHSHVYLPEFDEDRPGMLDRAKIEGVTKVIMPAIDSTTHEKMIATEAEFPGECFSMMGLHPCSVREDHTAEFDLVSAYLQKRPFKAIGEIGLDYYWDLSFKEAQIAVFRKQIELALNYNLPIVIHSRDSIDDCIKIVSDYQDGKLMGVFHCFSGSLDQAKQITDLGFFLGIGGVVTFKNSGLDRVMEEIHLSHVVLETDAPYLAPAPFRGKRNECSYLRYVIQKLSEVKKIDIQEIATVTTANAERLFRL